VEKGREIIVRGSKMERKKGRERGRGFVNEDVTIHNRKKKIAEATLKNQIFKRGGEFVLLRREWIECFFYKRLGGKGFYERKGNAGGSWNLAVPPVIGGDYNSN